MKNFNNYMECSTQSGSVRTNPAFTLVVSVQAYHASVTSLIKNITPPNFPDALRIVPFDAETPLHVCVTNKPLGEVLQLCAALLNRQWREEKATDGSQSAYVLEPKPDAMSREKALYAATLDNAMEALLQTARLAARHSNSYWQKEYQKVKTAPGNLGETSVDKSLLQYLSGSKGSGQAFFALFAGLTRIQQRTLAEQGYFYLPWKAMNTAQQHNALASQHSENRPSPNSAYDMTPDENRAAEQRGQAFIQQFGTVLSVDKSPVTARVIGYGSLGIPKTDNPFVLPVRGNPYLFTLDTLTITPTMPATETAEIKPTTEKKPQIADEVALEAMPFPVGVRLTQKETWADVIQTLAQKVPFAVVSDAYTAARCCLYSPPQNGAALKGDLDKMTIAQALDAICTAYNYLWWYEPGKNNTPGVLFFRSRAWFVEKQYEPPLTAIKSAEAALRSGTTRSISVALVDSVAGLTVPQIQGIAGRAFKSRYWDSYNFGRVPIIDFMKGNGAADAAFWWLHLWSHLPAEQKQSVVSKEGLPVGSLSDALKNELWQKMALGAAAEPSKAILRVFYAESLEAHFLPDYAPHWGTNELRPCYLTFALGGAGATSNCSFPLPVALTPPPQPKKADAPPKKV